MKIEAPNMRFVFQSSLLALSDIEYQQAIWVEADKSQLSYEVGFHLTTEFILNDIIWEADRELIGYIFRNEDELKVSLQLADILEEFIHKKGGNLTDTDYIADTDWLKVVAASRHVLRVMNTGGK